MENQELFSFLPISEFYMTKKIQNIDLKKANTIPPKVSKVGCNTPAETLHNLFNKCLITSDFPDSLKLADITQVFIKKDPLNKLNYRPVSVLPNNFEKLMQKQINGCINIFFISLLMQV